METRVTAIGLGRTERDAAESVGTLIRQLFAANHIDHAILSGRQSWLLTADQPVTEAQMMQRPLEGIPAEYVTLDEVATATITNFTEAKQHLARRDCYSVLIVCIPYASWRAKYVARKVLGRQYSINAITSNYRFPGGVRERLYTIATEAIMFYVTWRSLRKVTPGHDHAVLAWWEGWQRRYLARRK